MAVPYWKMSIFGKSLDFGRLREKKTETIKSLQDSQAFAPLKIQNLQNFCKFYGSSAIRRYSALAVEDLAVVEAKGESFASSVFAPPADCDADC